MEAKRQLRRQLIALARRRQRPGAGSSMAVLQQRTARMQYPDLSAALEGVPWAVVGAVATRLYMPERVTRDLDIVVRRSDAHAVRQRLEAAGFRFQGELSIGGSSWASSEGVPVDVLEMDEPWLASALQQAQHNRDVQGLPVLPLPELVLLKFQAGRVQDLADVTRMLGQATGEMLDGIRQLFRQELPEDVEDLESLITLGQIEMRPPQAGDEDRGR